MSQNSQYHYSANKYSEQMKNGSLTNGLGDGQFANLSLTKSESLARIMDAFKKSVSLNEAMPVPDLHAVSLVSHVCLALLYFSLPESSFV